MTTISEVLDTIYAIARLDRKILVLDDMLYRAVKDYKRNVIAVDDLESLISAVAECRKTIEPQTERQMLEGNILKTHYKLAKAILSARSLTRQYVVEYINDEGAKYVARYYWSDKLNRFCSANAKQI